MSVCGDLFGKRNAVAVLPRNRRIRRCADDFVILSGDFARLLIYQVRAQHRILGQDAVLVARRARGFTSQKWTML